MGISGIGDFKYLEYQSYSKNKGVQSDNEEEFIFGQNKTENKSFFDKLTTVSYNNDGVLSTQEKAENFGKGLLSFATSPFKSWKSAAITGAAILGGVALTVATGGAALPVLVGAGAAIGAGQIGYNGYKAVTAKTEAEGAQAFFGMGEGVSTLGLSIVGAKGSLKAAGVSTEGLNPFTATAKCISESPELALESAKILTNGEAASNLASLAGIKSKNNFSTRETRFNVVWGEENGDKLKLIHKDDFDQLKPGTKLQSLYGEEVVVGKDYIDMDTRRGFLAYGRKLTPEESALNLVKLDNPEQMAQLAYTRKNNIAIAGYSAPPDGYEQSMTKFTDGLVQNLGSKDVSLITSPTADAGSIDAIGTTIGQKHDIPIRYGTAQDYTGYINKNNFPSEINTAAYDKANKYYFTTPDEYSVSMAKGSNNALIGGGRNAAVNDYINAINEGNRAVVAEVPIKNNAWDPNKGRVDNASRYIIDQLDQFGKDGTLKYPDIDISIKKGDDIVKIKFSDFIKQNFNKMKGLTQAVDTNDPNAVKLATQHFNPSKKAVLPVMDSIAISLDKENTEE